ncbi:MAG: DUF4290 domain-containing protein [Rikenellaceae bacterium]|nr:DUF4290 domain-containing protein [Rikenellaceae bacterium]
MLKNYNYQRTKLRLPEYGRHIHDMVNYLLTIENRAQRTRQAYVVVAMMGNVNPSLRDSADFNHKLWDHLFIMSDFQLDVDSPYPAPDPSSLNPTPHKLEYPRKRIRLKHYGKYIENIIRKVEQSNDRVARDYAIGNVARYMRAKSYEFNQEHPNNEVIIKDIKRMSENDIEVDEVAITNLKSDYKQRPAGYNKRTGQKKNGGKNFKKQARQQGRHQ